MNYIPTVGWMFFSLKGEVLIKVVPYKILIIKVRVPE